MSTNSQSMPSNGSVVANFRDAVRVFRGKRPRHSLDLIRLFDAPHTAPTTHAMGIRNEDDLKLGTLKPNERPLLKTLVEHSRFFPGPIIEIGTLLGGTTTNIALWKAPEQKIITVDFYCWNPWGISPDTHFTLTQQMLKYLTESGQVEQVRMDKNEFFRTYKGPAPSLVFLDAIHDYEETKKDILWAKSVGAKIIAGHDYCDDFPGVIQVVDEFGGPAKLGGSVFCLAYDEPAEADIQSAVSDNRAGTATFSYKGKELESGTVSIVIPAYNVVDFIGEALGDITKQTYQQWEVIIVEDGSIDDCEEIVRSFQRKHPSHRIVYHRKPANSGVSNSRNQAISLCKGEFIAFLDGDDRWSPDHLERKIRNLFKTNADLVYSSVELFDSHSDKPMFIWGPNDDDIDNFPESMFRAAYIQPSSVVMRHSLAIDVGDFDEHLAIGEDYDYWLRAVQQEKKFVVDRKITSKYRKNHEGAATTDRLVLCYEGVARVATRYLDATPGNERVKKRLTAKNFLKAGCGHMGFKPSKRTGCSPKKGPSLLMEAWKLKRGRVDYLAYAMLASFAVATRTTKLFQWIFLRRYH